MLFRRREASHCFPLGRRFMTVKARFTSFRRIENPRSVMLKVVPCTADIANKDAVQLADDLDPKGQRTLGVLTKADLVDEGAEGNILDVINEKSHRLTLGWTPCAV